MSFDAADDASLIERIVQQDQTALAELYDRYAATVYAIAFKTLGSVQESEEVVLDVFAQVWRTAVRYNPSYERVDTWLFFMTRSYTIARFRTLKQPTEAIAAIPPNQPTDPLEAAVRSEQRAQILAALAQLPEEQRQVIELAHYKGLSQSEIAARLDLPLGTVKTRIRLGLNKLRIALSTWKPS